MVSFVKHDTTNGGVFLMNEKSSEELTVNQKGNDWDPHHKALLSLIKVCPWQPPREDLSPRQAAAAAAAGAARRALPPPGYGTRQSLGEASESQRRGEERPRGKEKPRAGRKSRSSPARSQQKGPAEAGQGWPGARPGGGH